MLVDAPSCQALSAVTLQLLQFQEDAFGRQAVGPPLTKLPVSRTCAVRVPVFVVRQRYGLSCWENAAHQGPLQSPQFLTGGRY